MIGYLKKMLSVLCVLCTAFSMTGCIHLKGTFNKTAYLDELKAEISKDNFVEEWTGDIPEGMKVKHVPVREWISGMGRNKTEHIYEYDSNGNMTLILDKVLDGETLRREQIYNDGGLLIAKKQKSSGHFFSSAKPVFEYECEYEYNGKGYLVCYRIKQKEKVREYDYEYNEEGERIDHSIT